MEIIIEILNLEYDDYSKIFSIDFITQGDGDEFFRHEEMDLNTFRYFYPERCDVRYIPNDLKDNEESIILMLEEYYWGVEKNEFPSQQLR
jgi:hypothetical protein